MNVICFSAFIFEDVKSSETAIVFRAQLLTECLSPIR